MDSEDYRNVDLIDISENDILNMVSDTSSLLERYHTDNMTSAAMAAKNSNALANKVEFWKWMDRNYSKSGIFNDPNSMKEYIGRGLTKEEWFAKQLQGKGFEWDWMTKQRSQFKNIFKRYYAGDIFNRPGSDVTEIDLLFGKSKEFQMKAYTKKTNPDLKNTPKDVTVITNAEKTGVV